MCQCNLSAMLTAALKKRNPKNTEQYSMKEISVLFFMDFLASHQMLLFKMYRNTPKHLKKNPRHYFYYYCYFSYYYGNEMYTVYQVYVYIWGLLHSRWNWLSYKTIITVLIRSYVCCNYLYNPWLWHRALRLHYRDRIWDFKKEGFGGNCQLIWGFNCTCVH